VRARVALGFIARRLGSAGLRCSSDGGDCRAACSRTRGDADSRKSSEEDDTAGMEKAAEGRQRFSVFLSSAAVKRGHGSGGRTGPCKRDGSALLRRTRDKDAAALSCGSEKETGGRWLLVYVRRERVAAAVLLVLGLSVEGPRNQG
jgi:hypothetical protein